jgi:phosphatidate cytidylyltransferase
MTSVEPPVWSEPGPDEVRGAYRARHGAAPAGTYREETEERGAYADDLDTDRPGWPPHPAAAGAEVTAEVETVRPGPVPREAAPFPGPEDPPLTGAPSAHPDPDPAGDTGDEGSRVPPAANGRAGRNLPAAIAVGLSLGAVALASLLLWRPAFLLLVVAAAGVAVWEMVGAFGRGRVEEPAGPAHPPLLPLLAGCVVMTTLAWFAGVEALVLGLLLTVLAAMVWRLADGPAGYLRDITAATLIAVYVPFLAGFAVLLARPDDGDLRVIVTLAAVVLSDTGGYAAGVFLGRRPMAPSVSPKKSWEGFGGSLVATAVGGALLLALVFHRPWWYGVVFGLALAAVSVLGDLAESLLKRDLGVKDMSNLLPGHGGLMDRMDSILFAAPTAFVLLTLLAPVPG